MNKIRPSLQLYFLITMVLTGVVTVTAMTVVSVNFYFAGLDFSKNNAMQKSAYKETVRVGEAKEIDGFIITKRWEDLPESIKNNLNENELIEGELLKRIIGVPIFSPPEAGYFAMMIKREGETRYVSSFFSTELEAIPHPPFFSNFLYVLSIALTAIALFSLVPFLLLRKVATPIEKLIVWAKQLNSEKLLQPTPQFHYHELDSLANIIQSSLSSVQETLAREMRFLGYASHELRTPISVTRTNTELLQKMLEKGVSSEKQLIVLKRIERASLTMTDLTETLLWLNRQQDKSLPITQLNIGALTQKLTDELAYLLIGKKVEVSLQYEDTVALLPEALCSIIITNLIRNAFQHTHEGLVKIEQSKHCLRIINENTASFTHQGEQGFGLGLELTEKLVKHQGWTYHNIEAEFGHEVEIEFSQGQKTE